MNVMAPTRPIELHRHRVCLPAGPAAAAVARGEVRAAICTWDVPVDLDIATLLTSELVTNAIRHEAGGTVTLTIARRGGQLRVDVYDTSCSLPVVVDASAGAETGRGLMLVATLSADWGFYRTPTGKAVYFTLAPHAERAELAPETEPAELAPETEQAEPAGVSGRGSQRGHNVGTVSRDPPGGSPSPPDGPAVPAAGHLGAMVRRADSRAMSVRE